MHKEKRKTNAGRSNRATGATRQLDVTKRPAEVRGGGHSSTIGAKAVRRWNSIWYRGSLVWRSSKCVRGVGDRGEGGGHRGNNKSGQPRYKKINGKYKHKVLRRGGDQNENNRGQEIKETSTTMERKIDHR